MAEDTFQTGLNQVLAGQTPAAPSGAGVDELQNFIGGQQPSAIPRAFDIGPPVNPGSPPTVGPGGGQSPPPTSSAPMEPPGLGGLFLEGAQRNISNFHTAPYWAAAAYHALNGNLDQAQQYAQQAQDIEAQYPNARWSLDRIRSLDDFASWSAERLGENSITLLGSMLAGAGGYAAGASVANRLVAQGLLTEGSRAAMLLRAGGAAAGGYPLNSLLEFGGTAQEQNQVTGQFGQTEARRAILGGTIKGALESITPFVVSRALTLPGYQLGRTYAGGLAKIAGLEGVTEMSQEAVDVWLRQLADPSYSYFDNKATWYLGPGAWRVLESGAAGALVGGIYGGAGHYFEQRQEHRAEGTQQEYVPAAGAPQGGPAQVPELNIIAPDKVDVSVAHKQPIANGPQIQEWQAKSPYGEVYAIVDPSDKTLTVATSSLNEESDKGQGHGMALYKALFDKALAEGYTIHSDAIVSGEAARVYEAFRRRGYDVQGPEPGAKKFTDASGDYYTNPDILRRSQSPPIFQIKAGPVTLLRQQVIGQKTNGDRLTNEVSAKDPRDDVLGESFLGYDALQETQDAEARKNAFLDLMEANTKRYVEVGPDGQPGNIHRNSTDVETYEAMNRSQDMKPQWMEVDSGSLQPSGITATFQDLVEPGSDRIWFLPNVDAAKRGQVLQLYNQLYQQVPAFQRELLTKGMVDPQMLQAAYLPYNALLSQGLRVIPSRGASFHYSGGKVAGRPVDVAETRRSVELAWLDFDSGILYTGVDSASFKGGIPVAINHEMVDALKVQMEAVDGGYRTTTPIPLSTLVPGYAATKKIAVARADEYLSMLKVPTWKWWDQGPTSVQIADDVLPQNKPLAEEMRQDLGLMAPTVDSILDTLGLDRKRLDIVITDDVNVRADGGSAAAAIDNGQIWISPDAAAKYAGTSPLGVRGYLHETLFHEVGHFVTYELVNRLPVGLQAKLQYAWKKTQLTRQLDVDQGLAKVHPLTTVDQPFFLKSDYYFTFSEWLAEQFRRWAYTQWPVRTQLDVSMASVANKLETFYKEWEQKFGWRSARNMLFPDYHFTMVMDYFKNYGVQKQQVDQFLRQHHALRIGEDLIENPQFVEMFTALKGAFESMAPVWAGSPDLQIKITDLFQPGIVTQNGAFGSFQTIQNPDTLRNQGLIELALGSLPSRGQETVREGLAHELWHWYDVFGIVSPAEQAILDNEIRANRDLHMSPAFVAGLQRKATVYVDVQIRNGNLSKEFREVEIDQITQRLKTYEERAYYMQQFANSGLAYSNESRTVFQRIMELLQRIGNALRGLGFRSREDVIRAFFKGEMLTRYHQAQQEAEANQAAREFEFNIDQNHKFTKAPDFVKEVEPGLWMVEQNFGKRRMFLFMDSQDMQTGNVIGTAELTDRGTKGWEVDKLESTKVDSMVPLSIRMGKHISDRLGIPTRELYKPPAAATEAGMTLYQKLAKGTKWEGVFDWYVRDHLADKWYSPNYVRKMKNYWDFVYAGWKADGNGRGFNPAYIRGQKDLFDKLIKRVPKRAWSDPRLPEMFIQRNAYGWDELQGSLTREATAAGEAKLQQALGDAPDGPTTAAISRAVEEKARISQAAQARRLKIPFDMASPETGITLEVSRIIDKVGGLRPSRRFGYRTSGEAQSLLSSSRHQIDEMDRIGWFSKRFLNLPQLARINEHLGGLIRYNGHNAEMYQMAQSWIRAADEVARAWETRPAEAQDRIAKLLFWMTEQKYRSPNEVAAKVSRMPTGPELAAQMQALKMDPLNDMAVVKQVQALFARFLDQVEAIRTVHLQRTFASNPAGLGIAIQELRAEMQQLRSKPYFPMMRFGKYNITVRDPGQNHKVVWASSYETVAQRDAALAEVALNHPNMRITYGTVPESAFEFMSMPGPLIRMIKERLPTETGVQWTADQEAWFEHFEAENGIDRNFRKRWMPTQSTAGYSLDAFRSFAHYFQNGARYISRLQYLDALKSDIESVRATVRSGQIQNSGRRQAIVDYMTSHFKYMMEGGRDYAKTKAFLSLYFLGFSPAAAAVNLTQVPTVLLPTLHHHFGAAETARIWKHSVDAVKAAAGGTPIGDARFLLAREEMVNQGRIDVGLAPELGAFAEGYNLNKMKSGSRTQMAWRAISWAGMKMFGLVEQFNRELTFNASWNLALKHYDSQMRARSGRLFEIQDNNPRQIEINSLMARLGLSEKEAVAFIFAREMIDTTQFMYAPYARPPFMQKPVANLGLLFFQYTQGMLVALRYNGAAFQMLLTMAFLYGLQGLPGSEDANELLRALGRKLFGKDWDIHGLAREYVRTFTRGTIFDAVGPDLVLHGISRYGFGAGLLPEGYGIPRFDASANGSMGRIVPGLTELAHGLATGSRSKDTIADVGQRISGAGGGMIFSLLAYLMESPGTIDSKKWEALLPRFMRGLQKAYRYGGDPQAETTQGGAKIVKFDVTDPDDLMTVVAQAMGFTPTRVSETWEALRTSRDTIQVYTARKQMIYAQAYRAVKDQNQDAFNDVLKAIRDYNEQVIKVDPSMAIQTRGLLSSIRNRQRSQALTEQFGASNRGQIPVVSRVLDQYPGVRMQRVQ